MRPPLLLLDLRRRQVRGGVAERWRRVLTVSRPCLLQEQQLHLGIA
eukprot:CAMPEP_0180394798 /NCGR_PEP_ID=MMETSP0989-20121125/34485_1 /TAXON_ID=697907 /ORGANISM="non described non described, Strain CCMP2293" /LENGTH=45 /DNA_ID= /DNA_START= /DNA_END= /DNA_ORIENTATION=